MLIKEIHLKMCYFIFDAECNLVTKVITKVKPFKFSALHTALWASNFEEETQYLKRIKYTNESSYMLLNDQGVQAGPCIWFIPLTSQSLNITWCVPLSSQCKVSLTCRPVLSQCQ